jgi:hypothetical protein
MENINSNYWFYLGLKYLRTLTPSFSISIDDSKLDNTDNLHIIKVELKMFQM